jgi:hypothetical protein
MEAYGNDLGAKDAQIHVFSVLNTTRLTEGFPGPSALCVAGHIDFLFRQDYIIAAESGSSNIISPSILSISDSSCGLISPHLFYGQIHDPPTR